MAYPIVLDLKQETNYDGLPYACGVNHPANSKTNPNTKEVRGVP
jgi:hypothetical protein